jgi:hypothetical protein
MRLRWQTKNSHKMWWGNPLESLHSVINPEDHNLNTVFDTEGCMHIESGIVGHTVVGYIVCSEKRRYEFSIVGEQFKYS